MTKKVLFLFMTVLSLLVACSTAQPSVKVPVVVPDEKPVPFIDTLIIEKGQELKNVEEVWYDGVFYRQADFVPFGTSLKAQKVYTQATIDGWWVIDVDGNEYFLFDPGITADDILRNVDFPQYRMVWCEEDSNQVNRWYKSAWSQNIPQRFLKLTRVRLLYGYSLDLLMPVVPREYYLKTAVQKEYVPRSNWGTDTLEGPVIEIEVKCNN